MIKIKKNLKKTQLMLVGVVLMTSFMSGALFVGTPAKASAATVNYDAFCREVAGIKNTWDLIDGDRRKMRDACKDGYVSGDYNSCFVRYFIECAKGVEHKKTLQDKNHKSPFDIGCSRASATSLLFCYQGYTSKSKTDEFCTAAVQKRSGADAAEACKIGFSKKTSGATPAGPYTGPVTGSSSTPDSSTTTDSNSGSGGGVRIAGEGEPDPINTLDKSLGGDDVPKLSSGDVLLPNESATSTSFIEDILKIVFSIAGALAFLVMVIAGLRYIAAAGDPQKTAQAKNTIIYALIGLVVAISAQAIVVLVVRAL